MGRETALGASRNPMQGADGQLISMPRPNAPSASIGFGAMTKREAICAALVLLEEARYERRAEEKNNK